MRVLFTVFASRTHMYNMVQLAWALRSSGHEVCVAGQPDLVDMIATTGLSAVPVGKALTSGSDGWRGRGMQNLDVLSRGLAAPHEEQRDGGWEYVLGEWTMACGVRYESLGDQHMVDDLVKFARTWEPDLVVWDAMTFAGPVAAIACGAAHARMNFGRDYIYRLYQDYVALRDKQPPEQRDDPLEDWFTGRLARIGHEYDPSMAKEMLTGQWTIDPLPEWLRVPTDLPSVHASYVPYNGRITISDWVYRKPEVPRVCLSFGVSLREHVGGAIVSIEDMLGAVADLDIEVIATLDASQVDPAAVPDNVTLVGFVSLNELMPSCSVAVHQGGYGTYSNALVHGVPSLIIPHPFWDEAECGVLFEERGAGLCLTPEEFTPEAFREKLVRLLEEPHFRRTALELRQEIHDAPKPLDVVPRLEQLTAQHRGRDTQG